MSSSTTTPGESRGFIHEGRWYIALDFVLQRDLIEVRLVRGEPCAFCEIVSCNSEDWILATERFHFEQVDSFAELNPGVMVLVNSKTEPMRFSVRRYDPGEGYAMQDAITLDFTEWAPVGYAVLWDCPDGLPGRAMFESMERKL